MTFIGQNRFTAVVLAADRSPDDPVARAAGVACKALAPVGGRPMLLRVLDALAGSPAVGGVILCGPPEPVVRRDAGLRRLRDDGRFRWLPPERSPSTSALAALRVASADSPVLLTTADHALLRPEVIDHFCREALTTGADVAAGLASYEQVMERFPGMRRTRTRFSNGAVCGCNLFAFLSPEGRRAADLWRQVENDRKHPVRMLNRLGWGVVVRYLLGRLSLEAALSHVSRRMGVTVGAVRLPFAEAAVDVDTVADWHFAESIAARRETASAGRGAP
jgi:GTP:adenosylcobinamide-phosphate guanylyltransferase